MKAPEAEGPGFTRGDGLCDALGPQDAALRREGDGAIVVEQLFVAPGHERRGIGHRLLAHAEGYAIAERAGSLQVVVEENNRQARSFYRRSGFVPVEPELFELILPRAD